MPGFSPDAPYPAQLRAMAESLLKQGIATASDGHFCGVDALSVLYKMACSPDSAADSLKMLHELQTLQIELDLQREQTEANASETEAELKRYRTMYDFAPVGYLVINRDGRIVESNLASAALFGSASQEVEGLLLEGFIAPASRPLLNWQLKKMFNGSPGETSTLQATERAGGGLLRAVAALSPDADVVFLTMSKQECLPTT